MNKRTNLMIQKLRELTEDTLTKIDTEIELDIQAFATLEIIDGRVIVRADDNTKLSLSQITDSDLANFCTVVGIFIIFDYIILTKDNEWLRSGIQTDEAELQSDLKEVMEDGHELANLVVIKATEFFYDNNVTLTDS